MAKVIPWLVISIVFCVAGCINNKAHSSSGASADQEQQNSMDKSAAMDNAMSMHGSTSTGHDWSEDDIRVLRRLWIGSLPDTPPGNSNAVADNPDAVELGQRIFFDKRFSANGKVSCASCHKPELYFTDGLQVAKGIGTVTRNTPTVVGASYNAWFFHDGRADSLWSQALGPLENPLEHGGTRSKYAHLVYSDKTLRQLYKKLFGAMPDLSDKSRFPVDAAPVRENSSAKSAWNNMKPADRKAVTQVFVNIGKTIEAYERKLNPGPSKFDRYVEAAINKDKAKMKSLFSDKDLAGLRVFMSKGNCMICHNGPLFTDYGFHNTATPPRSVKPYDFGRYKGVNKLKKSKFNCLGEYNDAKEKNCDELKYLVTHREETYGAFKTPSLRNVTKTAPYMHAGQYKTLPDVLKHYADPPSTKIGMSDLLPVELDDKDLVQLEAFLLTLDSPINADPELLSPYVP
ncbi:cytochrome-c peroxidase [Pseudomonadota bacterium]